MKRVCREWVNIINSLKQHDWKGVYRKQANFLADTSAAFDWKSAAMLIENDQQEVEAVLPWLDVTVRIVAPWEKTTFASFCSDSYLIDSLLINGVQRDWNTVHDSQGTCIRFVYDDAFELRAIRTSCKRRGQAMCQNCRTRKRCLYPKYSYSVARLTYGYKLNDSLCMRVRRVL
jgi:hypothetical protein